ncbi:MULTISPECIES: hypothetical protein [unclassified Spirillospora]|uniref:hypothetical protein n=1 Tax=unclassified Spirillospora TaxID=2642701 RepID=UPI0037202BDA
MSEDGGRHALGYGSADGDLVRAYKSKDVMRAAASWIAATALPEGFTWIQSKKCLERKADGRQESIALSSSYRNRPDKDIQIWIEALEVRERDLLLWRRRHPDFTLERPGGMDDLVCASSYIDFCDQLEEYQVNLTVYDERPARLSVLADHVRRIALPWFQATAEPGSLADSVWDEMILDSASDLMEYAVSKDLPGQARSILDRARNLAFAEEILNEGRFLAEQGRKPAWNSPHSVGWTAAKLNLLD